MNSRLHKTASLALIRALQQAAVGEQKGRLGNLFAKLQAETETALGWCPKLKKADRKRIEMKMRRFFQETGWYESKKNIRTYLSFLCLVVSKYRWEKIERVLLDIVEFNERIMPESRRALCDHAGLKAFEMWEGNS